MKKTGAIILCMFMLAALPGLLTGVLPFAAPERPVQCRMAEAAQGEGGAAGASESVQAFVAAAESFFINSILSSTPWDELGEDDIVPLDPVAQFEWYLRPLFNLGVSKDSMEREKNSFGWKSVAYEERGNEFRVVCEYADGSSEIYKGTYDQASDRLLCRLMRGVDSSEGIWADLEFEYMKTDFGYVARVYDALNNVVHKLAIKGGEGVVSWGETKFDTLHASMDYPKEGRAWYEISGDRFVLQPWDGPAREYKIER